MKILTQDESSEVMWDSTRRRQVTCGSTQVMIGLSSSGKWFVMRKDQEGVIVIDYFEPTATRKCFVD